MRQEHFGSSLTYVLCYSPGGRVMAAGRGRITLEDLAAEFGVSRERVRQIEVRALTMTDCAALTPRSLKLKPVQD